MQHPIIEAANRERLRHPPIEFDDRHNSSGELAKAAAALLLVDPNLWPYADRMKTNGPRKNDLVRATALIMAEWDRLERKGKLDD